MDYEYEFLLKEIENLCSSDLLELMEAIVNELKGR